PLYPVRVLAGGAALAFFLARGNYRGIVLSPSPMALGAGVLAFLLWRLLAAPDPGANPLLLSRLPAFLLPLWRAARTAGHVVLAPVAEELAFRGFLLRRLQADDFEQVPPGQLTWFSLLGSSLLFGLMHGSWVAGTLAGLVFGLALGRRRELG